MSHLKIEDLQKTFGTHRVLDDIHLNVARGEFIALLGPSGCGKSTLLRIIAGLERPSAGRIHIEGRDITALPPEKRNVALMFQSYALMPHMTVAENVRFPLRMQSRHSRAEQDKHVGTVLDLVQLQDLRARYPRQLSGGQQQRVALARSIVAEPDVLLLDEPLSNLDARLREDMQVELKRLHEKLGLTTVFVTHDQTEALALADTIVLLNAGVIEQQGTPEEIYRRPRTVFAADFIGGANILGIRVKETSAGWQGTLPDGTTIRLNATEALAEGARKFMLRKEAISLSPMGSDMVTLTGTLEARSFLGGVARSVVSAGGLRLIAIADAKTTLKPGTEIQVGWDRSALVLLDERD